MAQGLALPIHFNMTGVNGGSYRLTFQNASPRHTSLGIYLPAYRQYDKKTNMMRKLVTFYRLASSPCPTMVVYQ